MNSLVTLPVAGVATAIAPPLAASAVPQLADDPAFAAVADCRAKKAASDARCRRVTAAYRKAKKKGIDEGAATTTFVIAELGCDPDEFTDATAFAWWDSVDALCRTQPTTLEGALAILRHAASITEHDEDLMTESCAELIRTLAAALTKLAAQA